MFLSCVLWDFLQLWASGGGSNLPWQSLQHPHHHHHKLCTSSCWYYPSSSSLRAGEQSAITWDLCVSTLKWWPLMHGPFRELAAVKALQLTFVFPKTKGHACFGFWGLCDCIFISSCPSPTHCFHVCCLTSKKGSGRETQQEKEKRKNAADLGKVPHHTGCPVGTTNSPC